jgi:Phage integrase family
MAGVPLRTVAKLLGHKTLAMTMRYAHLAPAHLLDAVECLTGQNSTDTRTDTGVTARVHVTSARAR